MDETYIKVRGVWKYLYCAVDKQGKTVDFLLAARRDMAAAKRFSKAIGDERRSRESRDRQEPRQQGGD
jgi:putative transposase